MSELDLDSVLTYLKDHPNALEGQDDLVNRLWFKAEQGDEQVVGFQDYQLLGLRKALEQSKRQSEHFQNLVLENEKLLEKMHQLVLSILEAETVELLLIRLQTSLRQAFDAEILSIYLPEPLIQNLSVEGWILGSISTEHDLLTALSEKPEPICGRLTEDERKAIFGETFSDVRSLVMLPMQDLGLLSIASLDEKRYTPDMGTDALAFLTQCLKRVLARHFHDSL